MCETVTYSFYVKGMCEWWEIEWSTVAKHFDGMTSIFLAQTFSRLFYNEKLEGMSLGGKMEIFFNFFFQLKSHEFENLISCDIINYYVVENMGMVEPSINKVYNTFSEIVEYGYKTKKPDLQEAIMDACLPRISFKNGTVKLLDIKSNDNLRT